MCKPGITRVSFLLSAVVTIGCGGVSTQSFSSADTKKSDVSVTISPKSATIQMGQEQQFVGSVTGTPGNLVSWSATNGTIGSSGLFRADGSPGSASVTATSVTDSSKWARALRSVSAPLPISVNVSPSSATVLAGQSQQLIASVLNAENTSVIWSSTGVGMVNAAGLYLSSIPGSASVIATSVADNTKSATAFLSVNSPPVVSVTITPSFATLRVGDSQQFSSSVSNASNNSVVWSSTGAGSVTDTGLYVASSPGTSSVIATSHDDPTKFATAQILVNPRQPASFDGPAELPRVIPRTLLVDTPSPGIITIVPAGGDVQTSINNAKCGDTIELQAGASFSGAFTLPAKACDDNHWIVVRTSAPDSALPSEGTRINPCYAGVASLPGRPPFSCRGMGVMTQVIAAKSLAAFTLAAGANHYRLGPGLEITRASGIGLNFGLIVPAAAADHIVIDRDWVHGTAQADTTRGIFLSGVIYAAVIDSFLNDFHCTAGIGACSDAQAIAGGTGPLPQGNWKISNNFLEASTENILLGGVLKNSATPADITITKNHFFKPLIWMPGQPGFVGGEETTSLTCPKWDPSGVIGQCPFVVKNLFELKNAQRVLFKGNVVENVWPGFSQYGHSILISGLNPAAVSGQPVYSTVSVESVTIRFNRIAHTTAGLAVANMAGQGSGTPSATLNLPVSNISVHDNIFDDLDPAYLNGSTALSSALDVFQFSSCTECAPLKRIVTRHNTVLAMAPKTAFILSSPPQQMDYTFADNLVTFPAGIGIIDSSGAGCASNGSSALVKLNACLLPNYKFTGNVLIGATGAWPTGNFFPSDATEVQFTEYNGGNGGDYHLLSTSPYKNAAPDGKDPGANVDMVQSSTENVQ